MTHRLDQIGSSPKSTSGGEVVEVLGLQALNKECWQKLRGMMEIHDYLDLYNICHKYLAPEVLPAIESENQTIITPMIDGYPISQAARTFIISLEDLHNYMKEKIERTPDMEKNHLQNLKQLFEENVAMDNKIAALQNKINALESHQKSLFQERQSVATIYSSQITNIRQKKESEAQMISDWESSEVNQASLIEEINNQKIALENIQKERLAKEKELRVRRYKVESQLVALLEQYDTDIGDRHRQKEELTAQLEEEKVELEQLQERFDEQEIEYNSLMQEKEVYDKRIFEDKLDHIRRKIACRKIQRWFRKCLERRAKGKKKGKGKKGKKK
ncbi:dynein regulatory complex protein 10-like [Lycorma delicatula]|uniref:dynein regulatory complex protein 10-like n=1 Tax=Lycorma delicatula TaxID=130591 RepID=UPI003F518634